MNARRAIQKRLLALLAKSSEEEEEEDEVAVLVRLAIVLVVGFLLGDNGMPPSPIT